MGDLHTGFLAVKEVNSNLATNLSDVVGKTLWIHQLKAMGITIALAVIGTVVIAMIVKAVTGLRVSEDIETAGLDLAEHGEEGYHG
ncbi:MAG: amtB 1 [Verrucomicrobiales bacterium]|nr:amtB 1 [Verrucomicrobiales bacterium]